MVLEVIGTGITLLGIGQSIYDWVTGHAVSQKIDTLSAQVQDFIETSKNSCGDVHHFFARLSVSRFPLLQGGRKGHSAHHLNPHPNVYVPQRGGLSGELQSGALALLQIQRVAGEYLLRTYQSRQDLLVVGESNHRL
jgi:hypothetical protein